jgi:hypothetical protein
LSQATVAPVALPEAALTTFRDLAREPFRARALLEHPAMSITLDQPRTSDIAARILRRHTIVASDGMNGALCVAAELQSCGHLVREFAVDVREGVTYSTVTCTVSMTAFEADAFAAQLRTLAPVVSVDPY